MSNFDHEKLEVYQKSIEFVSHATELLERIPRASSIWSQLDRASTSIPLNIAEGNGKWSAKDRCRFLDVAHGSALECAAALDVCVAKGSLERSRATAEKETLAGIVRMLIGLIKANDPERTFGKLRGVGDRE
ncbi:MAG: four helix bundle protein [Verrucomicrobiales bacterium]